MDKALFGKYYPAESPVHRMDARAKITLMVLAMVAVFCAGNFVALGVCALFLLAAFLCARIPLHAAFRSIAPLLAIVLVTLFCTIFFVQGGQVLLSLGPLQVSQEGVFRAVFMACRLTLLLLDASLLTLTTMSLDLTDGIEAILVPFARLGFPAHEFGMVMGLALRFLPQFAEELRIVRAAQTSRGANLATSPVRGGLTRITSLIVPLFASAFRHADTLANAMDARCYFSQGERTRLHPLAFSHRDLVGTVFILLMLASSIASSVLLG